MCREITYYCCIIKSKCRANGHRTKFDIKERLIYRNYFGTKNKY